MNQRYLKRFYFTLQEGNTKKYIGSQEYLWGSDYRNIWFYLSRFEFAFVLTRFMAHCWTCLENIVVQAMISSRISEIWSGKDSDSVSMYGIMCRAVWFEVISKISMSITCLNALSQSLRFIGNRAETLCINLSHLLETRVKGENQI